MSVSMLPIPHLGKHYLRVCVFWTPCLECSAMDPLQGSSFSSFTTPKYDLLRSSGNHPIMPITFCPLSEYFANFVALFSNLLMFS